MLFRYTAVCVLFAGTIPFALFAQAEAQPQSTIHLELNTLNDTEGACRLTFVAQNATGSEIDQAVFETVIFNSSGGVVTLSLFDFRDLPQGRPRVRQFDVPGVTCASVGRILINGSSTCSADGTESELCANSLSLSSRIAVELLG
ncbi:MAG: hypothetical protein WBV78_19175 [Roseobacter sp.]|jgi:hypothetical protein